LAYEHFFTAVSVRPVPTPQEQSRQTAQLKALQLAPADQQVFVSGLTSYRAQIDQIASAILAASPSQIEGLRAQKSTLVNKVLANLRQSLTPDGASRLQQYVATQVKTHIVIFGGPM
jgi:hypothetical protein